MEAGLQSEGRRTSILLVDDKPENLVALAAVLEPLGHRLVQASSGHEALRLLLREQFAVILLDVQMPGLDGFETAQLIKQRERTRDLPIIFVTALSKDAEHIFRGYSEGAVDYVLKPYEPEVLRSKVAVFAALWEKTAALEDSEQRFRSAFNNAPSGMALASADGTLLQVNRALAVMLGATQAELVGRVWPDLVTTTDTDRRALAELARTGRGLLHTEHRFGDAGDDGIELAVSASPAPGAALGSLILQVEDVGDRRRAERERAARAEAEARGAVARSLQRISDVGLAHLALDGLLPALLDRVAETLAVESVTVYLVDPEEGWLELRAGAGTESGAPRDLRVDPAGDSAQARALRERTAVTTDRDPEGEGMAAAAQVALPMHSGGEPIGVLCAATVERDRFDPADHDLFGLVADRAGLAISNARLYEREHRIVATLHRSLLPSRLPQLPGMSVAGRYVPGGPGTVVGGDWYDAIVLEGGRIGLAMGDVVGHGIDAAALMGELRNALRAYALSHGSPAEVVRRLDHLLHQGEEDRMATLVYAVVDPDWSTMRFASAGHPPPLIAHADGRTELLWGGRSTPVGAEPPEYVEAEAHLPPGATLLFYTDGLVEVRGESLDAGLARLERRMPIGSDPESVCSQITAAMGAEAASDDVAVLAFLNEPLRAESLRLTPSSDPRVLINVRRTLSRWLEVAGVSGLEAAQIELSVHEACANVVEHAYGFGAGTFELVAERSEDRVRIQITDEGSWRLPVESDRGRGISMMHSEMDEVEVVPGERGTTVELVKRIPAPVRATAS